MHEKEKVLNIQRTLYRYIAQKLGPSYYVNYNQRKDSELIKRFAQEVTDYWKWIAVFWPNVGQGIQSISLVQINCNCVIEHDPYQVILMQMHDEVQEELNENSITILDFSSDPENPVSTDNVLIPRYRGSRELPEEGEGTVQVIAMEYNLYVWRESVLP